MTREGNNTRLAKALEQVEIALGRLTSSEVGLLSETSAHIMRSGGKRLRPRVLLLSYEATGGADLSKAVPAAVAVELIHTASLVHDDINDNSEMRRGQATINARWGDTLALLAGDFIFLRVLDLIAGFESRVIRVLANACVALVEGETLQTVNRGDCEMSEETYLKIAGRKTASLFSACSELGAIIAGGTKQQVVALRRYGYNLGIAFQIRDDILDLIGTKDGLGKPVVRDLEQSKMSLATLFALRTSPKAREILFGDGKASAFKLLRETGALEYATQKAREYSAQGEQELSALPESNAREALCQLVDLAVTRDK